MNTMKRNGNILSSKISLGQEIQN